MRKIILFSFLYLSFFADVSFASEEYLNGPEAEAKWEELGISSQWQDDGWTFRKDSQWECKKSFNTDYDIYQYVCFHY